MSRLEELIKEKEKCELEISREITREKVKVMQAFIEGKDIEFLDARSLSGIWEDIEKPTWTWGRYKYRVKES